MFKLWSLASREFSWGEKTSKYWVAWSTYYLHGKTGNSGYTIKWLAPFRFEGSVNMDCDLRRCNFSTVKSVQLFWICSVAGRSPTTSNFPVLYPQDFPRVVFVKDKHPRISHVRSFFASYKFSRSIAYNSYVSGSSLPTSSPGLFPEKMGTRLHHHHHHHHHHHY